MEQIKQTAQRNKPKQSLSPLELMRSLSATQPAETSAEFRGPAQSQLGFLCTLSDVLVLLSNISLLRDPASFVDGGGEGGDGENRALTSAIYGPGVA